MKNLILSSEQIIKNFDLSKNNSQLKKDIDLSIVLLTGGAGFLGLYLLNQLVYLPECKKIYLPIRNKQNFINNKIKFKLNFPEEKIIFIYGDLTDHQIYQSFKNITHLIHCAAIVNNLKSAILLKNNIILSKYLYDFAIKNNLSCTLISTLSIFVSANFAGQCRPQLINPDKNYCLYGGYAQTKWACEYIAPLNTQIIRLGLLTPDTNHVIFNNGFLSDFIKLSKQIKIYPQEFEESFVDITPVNLAAQAIVDNLLNPHDLIVHIANKNKVSIRSFIDCLSLIPVDKNLFLNKLKNLTKINQVLLSYAWLKSQALLDYPDYYNIDLFQSTNYQLNGKIEIDNLKLLRDYCEKI
mgnify:CR=1 FL=1